MPTRSGGPAVPRGHFDAVIVGENLRQEPGANDPAPADASPPVA